VVFLSTDAGRRAHAAKLGAAAIDVSGGVDGAALLMMTASIVGRARPAGGRA
jgi:hypothetical protein